MEKIQHPVDHARGRKCADCSHSAVRGPKLLCALEPPKLFCIPMITAQGPVPQVVRAHPEMEPDDWCSKFEPFKQTH